VLVEALAEGIELEEFGTMCMPSTLPTYGGESLSRYVHPGGGAQKIDREHPRARRSD
jgi:hypothetical protein